uniref:ULP_PROTEASE domain-containing protein n=1 Tax=Steinernema glaseri TaxID=37863 RepID=A0A1I8A1Y9_9BILA
MAYMREEAFHELEIHEEDVECLYECKGIYSPVIFHMLHHIIPEAAVVHPISFQRQKLVDSEVYFVRYDQDRFVEWVLFPIIRPVEGSTESHWTLAVANMKTGAMDYYDSARHFYKDQRMEEELEQKLLRAVVTVRDNLPIRAVRSWSWS